MSAIELLAERQADWSATANELKSRVDTARWTTLLLSAAGATLAAIASQLTVPGVGSGLFDPRTWIAVLSVVSLASATFFTSRLLGADRVTHWIRARAISEELKREGFKFAAGASPYSALDANDRLDEERTRIEDAGTDLLPLLIKSDGRGAVPLRPLSSDDYVKERIRTQIDQFYRPKASRYRELAVVLRRIEFTLALLATLVTAVATVTGKSIIIGGTPFDIAALTAVLTTIGGAVVAHIEASRYEYLVGSYLGTARHLEDVLQRRTPTTPWSDFVIACEAIIAQENGGWITKWQS